MAEFRDLGATEAAENIVNPLNAEHKTDGGVKYTPEGTPYLQVPASQIKTDVPIYITPHFKGDEQANVEILGDERVNWNLISPPWPYGLKDAEFWINLNTSTPELSNSLSVLRAYHPGPKGTQIGGVDLHPTAKKGRGALDIASGGHNEHEIGYLLKPDWQGKGIMRAAVKEMVRYGTDVLGVDIIVRATTVNKTSTSVIESMEGWQRLPERDGQIEWPAHKGGGGLLELKIWKWVGTTS